MATNLCLLYGVMECWSTGLVDGKSRKNRFRIPLLHIVQDKFTHHSSTPSLQYSNWGEAPMFAPEAWGHYYEAPQVLQLVALQELQEDPCELENSPALLWLKTERSLLTLLPLHVRQDTSWLPKTKTSKSLSHSTQWYSKIGMVEPPCEVLISWVKI